MAIIEEVRHGAEKPLHAFEHMSPKAKMAVAGAALAGVVIYWWFFIRTPGAASGTAANGSTTGSGVATGTPSTDPGAGGGSSGTGGGTTTTTTNNYYYGPNHRRTKKPGKQVPKIRNPLVIAKGVGPFKLGGYPNHSKMNHPVGKHGHVSKRGGITARQFGQALGLVRKDRKIVRMDRAELRRATSPQNRATLRRSITRDRRAIQRNRQTIIKYRHPNKPGYLWKVPGGGGRTKVQHPLAGKRQSPQRRRTA